MPELPSQTKPDQSLNLELFQQELDRKVRELLELSLEDNGLFTLIEMTMEDDLSSNSVLTELKKYAEAMRVFATNHFTISIRERVDRSQSTRKGAATDAQLVERGADIGAVITIHSQQTENATEVVLNIFGDVRSIVNSDLRDSGQYSDGHAQRTDEIMNLQTQVNFQVRIGDNREMNMWCSLSPEGSDVLFVTSLKFSTSGLALELSEPLKLESDAVSYVFRKTGKNLRKIVRDLIRLKNRAKRKNEAIDT